MWKVAQFCGQGIVDGPTANYQVANLAYPLAALRVVQQVPHLQRHHGGKVYGPFPAR